MLIAPSPQDYPIALWTDLAGFVEILFVQATSSALPSYRLTFVRSATTEDMEARDGQGEGKVVWVSSTNCLLTLTHYSQKQTARFPRNMFVLFLHQIRITFLFSSPDSLG